MRYIAAISYMGAGPDEEVIYFTTRPFTTRPTDTPAHRVMEDRIINPALVRRDIFDVGTTGGSSRVGFGDLSLRNDDGALDWLSEVAVDGRDLVIYATEEEGAAFPADYRELLRITMEQPECTSSTLIIRLRDRQVIATRSLQDDLYGGTNALPNGTDGIASDLKNKPKPILYGRVFNAEPAFVNTSRNIYQANDGAVRDVTAVYDSGALLSHGDDYASSADMFSLIPAPGTFRVWKAGGMFRLGSTAFGQVTFDGVEGQWPVDRTAGQIFVRLLTERAGLLTAQISATDILAIDAVQDGVIGFYANQVLSVADALDQIAETVGAWWATDSTGTFRLQRLELPTGVPVLFLQTEDVQEGTLRKIPLNGNSLPAYQTTVRCVPNWTVQTTGLVERVGPARRARLSSAYQDATVTDAAVRARHRLSQERVVNTLFACRGTGEQEAVRLQAIYGVKRDRFELTIHVTPQDLTVIDLGIVIQLTHPRYGLEEGRMFRVLGYQLDPVESTATLTIWG